MTPKDDSTKKTPKNQAYPSTQHLRDEAINNESGGFIKEYPLVGAVELKRILPRGTMSSHTRKSPLLTRSRMKNHRQSPPHLLPQS